MKINAVIEMASDGGFSVYCTNAMFSGMGDTPDAAKQNMVDSISFFVDGAKADGYQYPAWLDSPYSIDYVFDTQSLFAYYSGVLTPAAMERLTGINQKQIWNYAHGKSKPRKPQLEKIQNGLRKFAQELSAISLL